MDLNKCEDLKRDLAAIPEPIFVPIDRFFDGNDDPGSIGCNLTDHPGVETFRDILVGLVGRDDVEAVYARIAELDPGAGCWAFTDTIYVVGEIPAADLQRLLAPLQPDEVGLAEPGDLPPMSADRNPSQIFCAWWD